MKFKICSIINENETKIADICPICSIINENETKMADICPICSIIIDNEAKKADVVTYSYTKQNVPVFRTNKN